MGSANVDLICDWDRIIAIQKHQTRNRSFGKL